MHRIVRLRLSLVCLLSTLPAGGDATSAIQTRDADGRLVADLYEEDLRELQGMLRDHASAEPRWPSLGKMPALARNSASSGVSRLAGSHPELAQVTQAQVATSQGVSSAGVRRLRVATAATGIGSWATVIAFSALFCCFLTWYVIDPNPSKVMPPDADDNSKSKSRPDTKSKRRPDMSRPDKVYNAALLSSIRNPVSKRDLELRNPVAMTPAPQQAPRAPSEPPQPRPMEARATETKPEETSKESLQPYAVPAALDVTTAQQEFQQHQQPDKAEAPETAREVPPEEPPAAHDQNPIQEEALAPPPTARPAPPAGTIQLNEPTEEPKEETKLPGPGQAVNLLFDNVCVPVRYKPLGILFRRNAPITIEDFAFNSYAKTLGLSKGQRLTMIGDEHVEANTKFRDVDKMLKDSMNHLPWWPLRVDFQLPDSGQVKTWYFVEKPLGIEFNKTLPISIAKFAKNSYAQEQGVPLNALITRIADEDVTKKTEFPTVEKQLLDGLKHFPSHR